jgi:PKHD-type hydroxylase
MKLEYYIFKNVYTAEQCADLAKLAEEHSSATAVDRAPDWKKVKTTCADIHAFEGKLNRFFALTNMVNKQHFGYDCYDAGEVYNMINLNSYKVGDNYDWHRDREDHASACDIKLTTILNVSDEAYEGGKLELWGCDFEDQVNQGDMVVFSSHISHRVTDVTEGSRKTISYWTVGPRWR